MLNKKVQNTQVKPTYESLFLSWLFPYVKVNLANHIFAMNATIVFAYVEQKGVLLRRQIATKRVAVVMN